jgi:putative hemolysin
MSQVISVSNLIEKPSWQSRIMVWFLDRLLGIAKMNRLYQFHQMQSLKKEDFADKLIAVLKLDIEGLDALKANIPQSGPVVIASNHPFGGIEGVILARAIGEVRPDLKVLANKGLGIFSELKDYFIFTNPLSPNDPKNGPSLRQCISHVSKGNALLLFPAGKVSYYQKDKGRISEHPWNKIVGRLISIDKCKYVPVFVSGKNSPTFYKVEALYFRLRMFLLGRELLNKTGANIRIDSGFAIENTLINGINHEQTAACARALSYAQESSWRYKWPDDTIIEQKPLATETNADDIAAELRALPDSQKLSRFKSFEVYYAYQEQAPSIVKEIARLRELVFRQHNEGSGEALDTDHFDATYVHLFIVESETARIIGAYRMGLTDQLLKQGGLKALYLSKMFAFSEDFENQKSPCIELGRSFLIPEFQGSYQGLLLLWRGICAFVYKFPQYRLLYGTVSVSKLYDARSVNLIYEMLCGGQQSRSVKPRNEMSFDIHPEIKAYMNTYYKQADTSGHNATQLSGFLRSVEADGKDIPVLAKQYFKMGAKFHALGIDTSFNHTPGLLLSIDLPKAPEKLLKLYFGDNYKEYRDYEG